MSALCHECGTQIDEDELTLCPRCQSKQSPERKLSEQARELAKGSSDSKLAAVTVALADALDEYEAAFVRVTEALEEAGKVV